MSLKSKTYIFLKSFLATFLVLFAFLIYPAAAEEPLKGRLIILTSFPDALFDPYKRAFQEKHPDLTIHVLNKKTSGDTLDRSAACVFAFAQMA